MFKTIHLTKVLPPAILTSMLVPPHFKDPNKLIVLSLEILKSLKERKENVLTPMGIYRFYPQSSFALIVSLRKKEKNILESYYRNFSSAYENLCKFLGDKEIAIINNKKINDDGSSRLLIKDMFTYEPFLTAIKNSIAMKFLPQNLNGSDDIKLTRINSIGIINVFWGGFLRNKEDVHVNINAYPFGEFFVKKEGVEGIFMPAFDSGGIILEKFRSIEDIYDYINTFSPTVIVAKEVQLF